MVCAITEQAVQIGPWLLDQPQVGWLLSYRRYKAERHGVCLDNDQVWVRVWVKERLASLGRGQGSGQHLDGGLQVALQHRRVPEALRGQDQHLEHVAWLFKFFLQPICGFYSVPI